MKELSSDFSPHYLQRVLLESIFSGFGQSAIEYLAARQGTVRILPWQKID